MSLWRDLLKPRNSFAAERTLFWIIFAFGLTPLRISTDYKIYSSRLGYIIALLQILFFTYCCIYSFTVLKNFGQQWEKHNNGMIISKRNPLKYNKSFYIYTMVNKKSCDTIKESMNVHQLICEVSSTANKYFTYQLLTIISIAFVIILFDAYYILETLLDKTKYDSKFHTFEFIIFFSIHMVLHLIAIVSIVETSNHALKMSEKTGNMVHILLNETKESDVKERLQQFSMQLLHLKINFTAADLFNVDRTLYFTISGALTTYLIILLQFNLNWLSQSTDRIQYNENYNNGHKMDDVLHNLTVLTI